jgi:O-antigen/teichoic acid export membrane protein
MAQIRTDRFKKLSHAVTINQNMNASDRVIKNTGILYVKMCITMFISLYTTRLILNSLGVSDFGIFNIVGGAIAMLGFLNAAMASATQRFMSYSEGEGNKEKQKKIFNVSVILHFRIAFIAGFVLLIAGYFFSMVC